ALPPPIKDGDGVSAGMQIVDGFKESLNEVSPARENADSAVSARRPAADGIAQLDTITGLKLANLQSARHLIAG
ncbi:MAG: hypothetical protein ACR2OM_03380, partial [Aestuariivirgaceae bacterium]